MTLRARAAQARRPGSMECYLVWTGTRSPSLAEPQLRATPPPDRSGLVCPLNLGRVTAWRAREDSYLEQPQELPPTPVPPCCWEDTDKRVSGSTRAAASQAGSPGRAGTAA